MLVSGRVAALVIALALVLVAVAVAVARSAVVALGCRCWSFYLLFVMTSAVVLIKRVLPVVFVSCRSWRCLSLLISHSLWA